MIINCMKLDLWESRRSLKSWGHEEIKKSGFIHCSTVETFHRIENIFNIDEPYVLLCIDESKLTSLVKFEFDPKTGQYYPHVYGLINNDAIDNVLPLIRDESGKYIKNEEFNHISEI